jgi:isocitrate lyase
MAVSDSSAAHQAGPAGVAVTARELFQRSEIDVVPGAGSPLEARLIAAAGFAAIYVSGYAHAATIYGKPDIGLVGAAETIANVAAIRQVVDLPLIVDADTGYGDVVNVRDTVRRLEQAGANAGETATLVPDMMSLDELNTLVGLDRLTAFEDSITATVPM